MIYLISEILIMILGFIILANKLGNYEHKIVKYWMVFFLALIMTTVTCIVIDNISKSSQKNNVQYIKK